MQRLKSYIVIAIFLILANCSSIYGGTNNSEGDQSISNSPTQINFETTVNTTIYKTVTFSNRSENHYEITNLAFVDNGCGAFSVYNVTDSSGNVLYKAGDSVAITVTAGNSVNINIQFSPTTCEVTSYTTTFVIYYEVGELIQAISISLVASVDDNTPDAVSCFNDGVSYYDEFDNPTERTLPVLSDGKKYYIKVNQMNAYLQTTGGFSSFSTAVGTHFNVEDVPEDEKFTTAYLGFTTDNAGDVVIDEIDECVGFSLPTSPTDPYFLGARVTITTTSKSTGTIDRGEDAGKLVIPGFTIKLFSFVNNSNSLLQSSNGNFEANVEIDLTTEETDANEFLQELSDFEDDNGEPFLNITSDDTLEGKRIRHGTVTLVGIGQFLNDDDVQMDDVGVSALIENESYLFIQIIGLVTQVEGE